MLDGVKPIGKLVLSLVTMILLIIFLFFNSHLISKLRNKKK